MRTNRLRVGRVEQYLQRLRISPFGDDIVIYHTRRGHGHSPARVHAMLLEPWRTGESIAIRTVYTFWTQITRTDLGRQR